LPLQVFKGINKHYLLLHFIVFIWGFAPILGRFITCDTYPLVWYRILITIIAMFLYIQMARINYIIDRKTLLQLAGIGVIIAIHWLCFYGAIKVSNVSVTLVAFSTGTLFSSLTEPLFFKRRIRLYEVVIGLIIIAGICFIFTIETKYRLGIILGVLAALTTAIFSVMNGLMIKKTEAAVISFYELTAAFVALSIFLLLRGQYNSYFFALDNRSILGLTLLSLVCTVFPFITSVNLNKYISPYTQVLTVNLEVVYGIVWAILFYDENLELKPSFYVGVLIILFAIFLNPIIKAKLHQEKPEIH
jgi:drug/metabolite transporter (DMT)-like permease